MLENTTHLDGVSTMGASTIDHQSYLLFLACPERSMSGERISEEAPTVCCLGGKLFVLTKRINRMAT